MTTTADTESGGPPRPAVFQTYKVAWALLTPREHRRAAGLFAVILATGLLELVGVGSIFPFLTAAASPGLVDQPGLVGWLYHAFSFTDHRSFLVILGLAVLGVIVFVGAFSAFSNWVQLRFTAEVQRSLSVRLLERYLHWPYPRLLERSPSELGNNVLSQVPQVVNGILSPALLLVSRGIVALAILALLLVIEPLVTLLLAGFFTGFYGITYLRVRRKLRVLGAETLRLHHQRHKAVNQAFGGLKEIKALGAEAFFVESYGQPTARQMDLGVRYSVLKQLPKYLLQVGTFGGLMVVLLVLISSGADLVRIVPLMGLFAFAGYRLLPALQEIMASLNDFRFNQEVLHLLQRDLLDTAPVRAHAIRAEETLPFEHSIELEHVTFQYPASSRPVLHDVSVRIPKNSSVAFVGATGAGKTTLIDILLGVLPPSKGALLVDGLPLALDNVRRWQLRLGYVPQDVFLLDETVARNVAYTVPPDRIDMDAVIRAAKAAHIHDFIVRELPEGYDTVLGERGVRLSGGQRQRIAIARALYRDPDVLVLDEATSDIDNATQASIGQAIRELGDRKTVILVAHRFSTIRHCDAIHVMDQGRIVTSGVYADLLGSNLKFQALAKEH